jgi:small subunit ribosomal protein S16
MISLTAAVRLLSPGAAAIGASGSAAPRGTIAARRKDRKEYPTTVAVKIKLARFGKIREPFYRIVVADARTRRSGRAIENIGLYHPKADPSVIQVDSDRAQYWLGVGAQPTESVLSILKVTGDWQKFKGLPGAEGTLRVAPAKTDKRSLYEAAMAQVISDDAHSATTPRKKSGKAAAQTPAAEPTAAEPAESTDAS